MLEPKKTKWRKQQRGRRKGKATSGNTIAFGAYGLVALEPAWITARQIEASRVAISHSMKKGAKMWVRIFPDKPVTKKPAETRMGKGKGLPEFWVSVVKPGRILFEVEGINEDEARGLMRLAASKLPIKTRFVRREEGIKYEGF
jgi:large subunit ribosomal protein L16